MNKSLIFASVIFINLFLAGCGSVPIPKVTKYSIDVIDAPVGNKKDIKLIVRRARGRSLYETKNIVVSPKPHVIDNYFSAQWVETPCNMLTDYLIASLAKKFSFVTSSFQNGNGNFKFIISVYIDQFDQVRRNGKWYAVLSLNYEIISAKNKKIVFNDWYQNKIELENSDVQKYVDAQNISIDKFCRLLSTKIADCK